MTAHVAPSTCHSHGHSTRPCGARIKQACEVHAWRGQTCDWPLLSVYDPEATSAALSMKI